MRSGAPNTVLTTGTATDLRYGTERSQWSFLAPDKLNTIKAAVLF